MQLIPSTIRAYFPTWLHCCLLIVNGTLCIKAAWVGGTKTARQQHEHKQKFQGTLFQIKQDLVHFCAISRDPTWSPALRCPAPPRPCQRCPGDQIWLGGCSVLSVACEVVDVKAQRQFLSWRIWLLQAAECSRSFFFLSPFHFLIFAFSPWKGRSFSPTWFSRQPLLKTYWAHTFTITIFTIYLGECWFIKSIFHIFLIVCSNLAHS